VKIDSFYESEIIEKGAYWESLSEVYSWWRMKSAIRRYFLKAIRSNKTYPARVLDVGSGIGTDIFMLNLDIADRNNVLFEGIDISDVAVKHANNLAVKKGYSNCSFKQANVLTMQDKQKYDIVVASELLEHIPVPERALKKINDVLKLGGFLILSTPNKDNAAKKIFSFFKSVVCQKHDWYIKRHGVLHINTETDTLEEDGYGHISVMTLKELRQKVTNTGFEVECISRVSPCYASRWLDDNTMFLGAMVVADRILDLLRWNTFSCGFVLSARKPPET